MDAAVEATIFLVGVALLFEGRRFSVRIDVVSDAAGEEITFSRLAAGERGGGGISAVAFFLAALAGSGGGGIVVVGASDATVAVACRPRSEIVSSCFAAMGASGAGAAGVAVTAIGASFDPAGNTGFSCSEPGPKGADSASEETATRLGVDSLVLLPLSSPESGGETKRAVGRGPVDDGPLDFFKIGWGGGGLDEDGVGDLTLVFAGSDSCCWGESDG